MKLITLLFSFLLLIQAKECGADKDNTTTENNMGEKTEMKAMQDKIAGTYDITKVGSEDFSDYEITMTIEMGDENKISGKSACNRYFGSFENPKANEVVIGMLAGTKMYCQDVADVEKEYLNKLKLVTAINPTRKGLDLLDKDGKTIIVAVKKETK
jgi:heat shock protein HslJ